MVRDAILTDSLEGGPPSPHLGNTIISTSPDTYNAATHFAAKHPHLTVRVYRVYSSAAL